MKKIIIIIFIFFVLMSCVGEIFALINTNKAIIVQSKVSENRYRCSYSDGRGSYFLEIITDEKLQVGDTLQLVKKQ